MRCTLALLGAIASASACLIANFQYFPIPEGSAKARPHLIGNLTSTTHPAYPSPICWLTKMKLESPNDMYPLYCIDPSMTAYIWMEGLDPVPEGANVPSGTQRGQVLGQKQAIMFDDATSGARFAFELRNNTDNENQIGAWNYDCDAEHALW